MEDGYILLDNGTKITIPDTMLELTPDWLDKKLEEVGAPRKSGGRDLVREVALPMRLKILWHNVFDLCHNLERVIIPEDSYLLFIGACAFAECKRLEEFDFEKLYDLVYIGDAAFTLSGLREVTIPNRKMLIGEGVFGGCEKLLQATFERPEIPANCFYRCSSLRIVEGSAEKVEYHAFNECTSLKYVTLPELQFVDDGNVPLTKLIGK